MIPNLNPRSPTIFVDFLSSRTDIPRKLTGFLENSETKSLHEIFRNPYFFADEEVWSCDSHTARTASIASNLSEEVCSRAVDRVLHGPAASSRLRAASVARASQPAVAFVRKLSIDSGTGLYSSDDYSSIHNSAICFECFGLLSRKNARNVM